MKQLYLALFTLKEYYRATWLYAEVILVVIAITLFLDHYWLLRADDIYLALGIFAQVSGMFTTLRVTNREMNPRIYILLTKALTRRDYLVGKLIAITIIDGVIIFLLFLTTFFFTQLGAEVAFFAGLVRLLLIYLVLLLTEVIMLCFSPLVTGKRLFLVGVTLIILGFYQPVGILSYILPPIQQLIKSSHSQLGFSLLQEFLLSGIHLALFYWLSCRFFSKRELNYALK